ncbi:MAG: dienelactone hydrolase family protein [Planctomycetota bacterium]|nr:dienelactone hydrolase family protein [Planctomycetota bacterium]MDG2144157.1 dienelactone hydrolase family protein [Planctomycetota bacterium]
MLDKILLAALLVITGPVNAEAASETVSLTPAVRGKDVVIETVDINVSSDLSLKASFYVPKGDERAPAALLIHDAGSNRASLADLAESMWKEGYAVLTLDLRGHGDSTNDDVGDYKLLETDKERESLWAFATRDVEKAARWLRSDKRVHSSNLSVVGVGAGTALAVRQASRDENVRTVTLLNPKATVLGFDLVSDMHEIEGLPTFFFATKESKTEVEALAKSIQDELGCEEFISCSSLKAKKDAEILEDKRLARTLTRGLSDLTFPQKKGRRG